MSQNYFSKKKKLIFIQFSDFFIQFLKFISSEPVEIIWNPRAFQIRNSIRFKYMGARNVFEVP